MNKDKVNQTIMNGMLGGECIHYGKVGIFASLMIILFSPMLALWYRALFFNIIGDQSYILDMNPIVTPEALIVIIGLLVFRVSLVQLKRGKLGSAYR